MTDTVTINGKAIDLSRVLPITMGDFRKLQKANIDVTNIKASDFESQLNYALTLLQKANSTLSVEDLDTLTADEFVAIVKRLGDKESTNRPLDSGVTT